MHIVYIHQYFTTPDQSGGIRSYEMSQRLIAAGHQVTMVSGTSDLINVEEKPGTVRREIANGIDLYQIIEPYSNSMGAIRRWIAFLKFAHKAWKIIKTIKNVDLVFATSTPLTVGDIGRKAAMYHRCPFVFEVRDLWPELPIAMGLVKNSLLIWYLKNMEIRSYRAASQCIALAPGIKTGIAKSGFPNEKIHVIPNGCDVNLFFPENSKTDIENDSKFGKPGDFRLVFAGAHGLSNGLDAILNVIIELKKRKIKGVRFCFIGSGNQKSMLMERSKKEYLDEYICWSGQLSKRELAKILPQMDIGLQILKNIPEFYNGTSPNKFFDYISSGIPVLNNYPGWIADYISERQCGKVVPPDNPEAFADAVIDLMNNRNELKTMGANARKLAEEVFSRDLLGKQFVETLETTYNEWQSKTK
jgi:glycosyltransferase involved in cell wall biosynthesis